MKKATERKSSMATLFAAAALLLPGASFAWSGNTSSMNNPNLNKSQIKEVQKKLNDKGYQAGNDDGIFGKQTQDAVRKFQKDNNEQATGKLDQQTLSSLGVSTQAAGQAPENQQPAQNQHLGSATSQNHDANNPNTSQ